MGEVIGKVITPQKGEVSPLYEPHMNHVSVGPTNENGPTKGQRKTLTRE